MSDIENLLNELRKLAEGKALAGRVLIPEDEFFILMAKLKKALPPVFSKNPPTPVPQGAALNTLNSIDELEAFIFKSKSLLGKVLINRTAYLAQVEKVAVALPNQPHEDGSMKTWK